MDGGQFHIAGDSRVTSPQQGASQMPAKDAAILVAPKGAARQRFVFGMEVVSFEHPAFGMVGAFTYFRTSDMALT